MFNTLGGEIKITLKVVTLFIYYFVFQKVIVVGILYV